MRQKKPRVVIRGDFLLTFLWQKKVGNVIVVIRGDFLLTFLWQKKVGNITIKETFC